MFIIGALIVVLMLLFKSHIDPVTYAVILIIGTAITGRGVTNWYEKVPSLKAKKWLAEGLKSNNTIKFEVRDNFPDRS